MVKIVIVAIISVISFAISYFQFKEKGYLFNNAYIWASPKERNAMNKKPYYRQSATVFCLIGVLFLLIAIEIIVKSAWLYYAAAGVGILLIIYAIKSSISIEKDIKSQGD